MTWHLYRLSPSFFAGTVLLQIMHDEGLCDYHMNPVATLEMDATIFGVNLAQMQVWDYNGNHSARKNKKINNFLLNSYVMKPNVKYNHSNKCLHTQINTAHQIWEEQKYLKQMVLKSTNTFKCIT